MLNINLHQSEPVFLPGQLISGYANWKDLPTGTTKVEARLIWYTNGKGDRDIEILGVAERPGPASPGELKFEFIAPHRPYSFSGQLISLTWAIEVIAFPSMDAQQAELVISPGSSEVLLYS